MVCHWVHVDACTFGELSCSWLLNYSSPPTPKIPTPQPPSKKHVAHIIQRLSFLNLFAIVKDRCESCWKLELFSLVGVHCPNPPGICCALFFFFNLKITLFMGGDNFIFLNIYLFWDIFLTRHFWKTKIAFVITIILLIIWLLVAVADINEVLIMWKLPNWYIRYTLSLKPTTIN